MYALFYVEDQSKAYKGIQYSAQANDVALSELLAIRRGEFEYEALLQEVEKRLARIEQVYAASSLPERPDDIAIESLLITMRAELYLRI
jgi:hypothetical protein